MNSTYHGCLAYPGYKSINENQLKCELNFPVCQNSGNYADSLQNAQLMCNFRLNLALWNIVSVK